MADSPKQIYLGIAKGMFLCISLSTWTSMRPIFLILNKMIYVLYGISSYSSSHIYNTIPFLDRINEDDRLDVLDSRTGMYKIKEYKPKRRSPKLREYKPQSRQFNLRKYEPKPELKVHIFDKIREYDHYYDVEPPDDETDRPKVCRNHYISKNNF